MFILAVHTREYNTGNTFKTLQYRNIVYMWDNYTMMLAACLEWERFIKVVDQ